MANSTGLQFTVKVGALEAQRRLWALIYLEGGRQALEEQKERT
ncbi:hypothetical protein [Pectobacterium fontis]|nr:hypothetical protein [Pectobacterium fontis]